MTIKIFEKFAPRANPADADYPYGSLKNESVPGARDGTPLDAAWANDYAGFDAALLAEAGITPSGTPDKLGASQRLDALKKVANKSVTAREALRRTYAEAGLTLVSGSFEAGGTLTSASDVLLHEASGKAYGWGGAFPKVVAAGSSVAGYADKSGELLADIVTANYFDESLETNFAQKVRLNQSDCYVLVQGDSTGNADDEWFRLTADAIAINYPTHTVKYVVWDHDTTAWAAPITVSTGSGPRSIWFYNGSHPGAVAGYWAGHRSPFAFNNLLFDVIFTNYGLNVPSSFYAQQSQHAEHLATLITSQPDADLLSCIQPVDYDIPGRNQVRAAGQKLVNNLYGVRTIDVMRKFLDLVESTNGDFSPWYVDSLHPSQAGSAEWSKLTLSALLTSKSDQQSKPGSQFKNAAMPNGFFKSFLSGSSAVPDFWVCPNTSALKDQVYYETCGQAVRVMGVGSGTGVLRLQDANEMMKKIGHFPRIVIAARVRSTGGLSGKCGKVFFAHSVSTSYTEVQNTQAPAEDVNGEFRWSFLLVDRSFWAGKSDFNIGVFSGVDGEFVTVDRITIQPSLLLSDMSDDQYTYSFRVQDSSHNIPANSTTSRSFTISDTISVKPGMIVAASIYPPTPSVGVFATCDEVGSIRVFYVNARSSEARVNAGLIKFDVKI